MPEVKAVVFDMDGVLIDAREWHYEALNRALGQFGFVISRYDHVVTFDGLPTRRKLELLSREQNLPTGLHEFLNELKQVYTMEIIHARCKPRFQHEYSLARLQDAGYRLAVASNSVRQTVDLMMEKSGLDRYLDLTVSNQDVSRGKPDPEIYLMAFSRLGIAPDEALIVEDSPYGIAAAKASGGHLMVVRDPNDVTWDNIRRHLEVVEHKG